MENEIVVPENLEKPEGGEASGIQTLEEALAELKKVRQEAASRRVKTRELEEKAKRWEEYEESQKTELQKLHEALAERDKKLSKIEEDNKRSALVKDLIKEYKLEPEDEDLLTGSDEESLKRQAERLSNRVAKNSSNPAVDLMAGNRGNPVGTSGPSVDDLIRKMANR